MAASFQLAEELERFSGEVWGDLHTQPERALLRRLGSWSCASPGDLTRLAKSEHRLFCARFCDVITPAEGAAKTE